MRFFSLLINLPLTYTLMHFFSKKVANKEPQNIDEILAEFKKVKDRCQKLSRQVKELEEKNRQNISKVGVVRFNPFEGFGGNQSFSLAMLDDNGRGAVITGLLSREGSRVYAKPLENGASTHPLSKEEKQAIEIAQSAINPKSQEPNSK